MSRLDEAPRWLLGIVAAAHGAVLLGLTFVPAARSFAPPQALAVALVAPPASAPAAPARPQQQPVPTPRQALPLATPLASPEPDTRAAAPAQSSHATAAAPAQLAVAAASSAAPAAPAAPAPILPPRFDAAYLNNPRPPYPPLARRMGEEGKATLRVFVTPEGLPGQIDLAESAGSPRLDEAALEAVRHWRFVPARQGETAVAAWVRVPIAFRLEKR